MNDVGITGTGYAIAYSHRVESSVLNAGSAVIAACARTEQGGMRDAARAQVALVLAKPVKDLLPVHAFLIPQKRPGIDGQRGSVRLSGNKRPIRHCEQSEAI